MSTVLHLPFDVEAGVPVIVDHSPQMAGFAPLVHDYAAGNYCKVVDAAGKYGGALALSSGYLITSYNPAWMDLQGDWTFEGWINSPLSSSSMAIAGRFPDSSGPWRFSISSAGHLWLDYVDSSGTTNPTSGTSTIFVPKNTWTHFAFVRSGTTMTVFVNGAIDYTQTISSIKTSTSAILTIGRSQQNTTWYLPGYLDDLRFSDTALYTAAFTPPDKISYTAMTSVVPTFTHFGAVNEWSNKPAVTANMSGLSKLKGMSKRLQDYYYGGDGTIAGHTYVQSGGDKTPVSRRVRLFAKPHGAAIAETWSDSTTGYYEFTRLSTKYKYFVLSFDHTGANETVVGDNLTPV